MGKSFHELRDPIHVFVRYDTAEREVIDSRPLQRLRHIHQLAMSYLVYPGATHRRFEHSLGVMELAGRLFDVLTNRNNLLDGIEEAIPELKQTDQLNYWRRVLRMAALCHDAGHLPFSHAAEKELLPEGWSHERLTAEIILGDEQRNLWEGVTPPLRPEDIVKLAVGPGKVKNVASQKFRNIHFTNWEAILSEVITGDCFGVDRIDYLLRDSHHAGVAYGKFDHFRLLDTMRILPGHVDRPDKNKAEPILGVEEGGLHSAEALLIARYFMQKQVYFHPVRRIYDIHLRDFLKECLISGKFSTDVDEHLRMTDNQITSAYLEAASEPSKRGHAHAERIVRRKHYRLLYEPIPEDLEINPDAGKAMFEAAKAEFGADAVRRDEYAEKGDLPDFPVLSRDGRITSAFSMSAPLRNLPVATLDYTYVLPEKAQEARSWVRERRGAILRESW
jgi:hypothetical protein